MTFLIHLAFGLLALLLCALGYLMYRRIRCWWELRHARRAIKELRKLSRTLDGMLDKYRK